MHSFWNAPICCRLGLRPQTSLGILQRFHRHLKLNMIGIKIWSTVADPGVIAPSNGDLFFPRSIPITDWQYVEWNWLKSLNWYFNSYTDLAYGGLCPQTSYQLNWIEFNTFKRRRLQIDQRRHTTNELNKLINVHNNFEKFIKSKMN